MISNLIASTYWYADVAVACFLALFIIGGIFKGFAKSTKGFFVFVFVACFSVLLMGLTHDAVMKSGLGTSINDKIYSASDGWGVAFNTPVYFDEAGEPYVIIEDNEVKLDAGEFGAKGAIANFFAKNFVTEEGQSVAKAAADSITSLCVSVIMFFVFVLAFTLLFALIRIFVKPLADTVVPGLKVLDKALGAVFSLLVGLLFVWIVFAIFASLGDKVAVVNEYLSNSSFAGLLYNNNPVTSVFASIFG